MKLAAISPPIAITAGFFGVAYFVFPGLFPPFYYADFVRARDQLSAIPGVQIIDNWQHHDITLEDCGFTVRVSDSEPVRIDFHDGDDWELPFKRVDGIIVSYPYNPRTNDYEEVSFSAPELEDRGIDATNLGTVLQNVETLLKIAEPRQVSCDTSPNSGVWVRIYRDLDRYKHGEQARAQNP